MSNAQYVGRRGRARMMEIAAENHEHIQELVAGLLKSLQRPATTIDLVAIETIAATTVKARRLRARGKDDSAERKALVGLIIKFLSGEQSTENAA